MQLHIPYLSQPRTTAPPELWSNRWAPPPIKKQLQLQFTEKKNALILLHNRRDIKAAEDGEADVLFWNSCNLKILVSLDSHGDWLGAELVACERQGDRSATNQNYSEAADWSLGCRRLAAAPVNEQKQAAGCFLQLSCQPHGTDRSEQHSDPLLNVRSKLGSKTRSLCCIQGHSATQVLSLETLKENNKQKRIQKSKTLLTENRTGPTHRSAAVMSITVCVVQYETFQYKDCYG